MPNKIAKNNYSINDSIIKEQKDKIYGKKSLDVLGCIADNREIQEALMKRSIIKILAGFVLIICFSMIIVMVRQLKQSESKGTIDSQKETATTEYVVEETTVKEKVTEEAEEQTSGQQEETTGEPESSVVQDENYKPVKLSFVGDFFLSPVMYENYQRAGISGIISPKIQDIFHSADIAVADHEYVSGDGIENLKVDYQQYTFLTPSEQEAILKDFSFDVMSLANNHTMDYQAQGLLSTMENLRNQGITPTGAGENLKEAMTPYTTTVNGKKIAILSATRVVPTYEYYATGSTPGLLTTYESTDRFQMIKKEITRLKTEEKYDVVVVQVHWGNDGQKEILDSQVTLGHGYIDAGADIVVGNHTHVLQGMEFYQGKLICYGISNFLFGNYQSDTMVLSLEIAENNSITAKMLPCSSERFYTQELEGSAATDMFRYIESMSSNVAIQDDGTITEKSVAEGAE